MFGFFLIVIGGLMLTGAIRMGVAAYRKEQELATQGRYTDVVHYRKVNFGYGPLGFFGLIFLIIGLVVLFV